MKMALLKYFKRIEPSKEERIQSILPKPDGPCVCQMPSLATEAANSTITKFFTHDIIDEDGPTACDKVMLKTVLS